ncbi:uncharacterized protein LOC129220107 [Uloborus diversus]|uniref:uncharacterized protein LOC129220107 n=1 Tax=Uloborus diversus TaxID=327109 RepID=UPI00240A4D28|nr:uncharacterized protein LOC129220107 [Uloborus diversus]
MRVNSIVLKKLLKLSVVVICTVGFLLQTLEFLFLYWTYPTVVDIQVTVPSEIDMPGITICNSNGLRPSLICTLKGVCTQPNMLRFLDLCRFFPDACENGTFPSKDFTGIGYQMFLRTYAVNASFMHQLRLPLSRYLKCNITSGSKETPCNLDDVVIGSYYSEYFMPNLCYTINSLWSNPNKKISKIQKSDRIKMEIYTDLIDRLPDPPLDLVQKPKYNYPSNPMVQIGVHSPYTTASPYLYGQSFSGGKKYEIKLKQDEKHLLPAPYQTNCTDYMPEWRKRNGVAPLNQIMAIQECKLNSSLKAFGCVPITVDFPHNKTIYSRCQTIWVEFGFDNFEITNVTYNPKFETLELFSVIGGYMGMYLGVSLLAVYDFGEFIFEAIYEAMKKRKLK